MAANEILTKLILDYSAIGPATKKAEKQIQQNLGKASIKGQTQEVSKLTKMLNDIGAPGTSVGNVFTRLFGKVGLWLGVTTIFYGLVRGVGALFGEMKNLEDATIRLKRNLASTGTELENNVKSVYSFSKAMNTLAAAGYKDTIDATTEAVKAGFSFKESLDLAKVSLVATNVTELTVAQSMKYLIATIRQFNLTSYDSLWILDQWNELGKRTGASTQGIAEAVTRAGAAFKAVGGTLSQLTALSAVTIEVTGESGEKIGTMFKTLSARYADMAKRGSLNTELQKINMTVYEESLGTYKNMFNVLYDLSLVWGTLEGKQQSQIAKAAAGIRQWSRFVGTIKNFDKVLRALLISIDSNSSALSENERRVNSYDFALKRFQGTWSQLALESSGFLNIGSTFLNIFRALITVLTPFLKLISSLPGWLVASATAAGLLAIGFSKVAIATKLLTALSVKLGISLGLATGGISVLLGLLVTLPVYMQYANDEAERMSSSFVETAIAALNSKKELEANAEVLIKVYKNAKTSDEVLGLIKDTFLKIGGIDLSNTISQTDDLKTAIKKIKDELAKTSDIEYALNNYVKQVEDALKKINWLTKVFTKKDNILEASLSVFKATQGKKNPSDYIKSELNKIAKIEKEMGANALGLGKVGISKKVPLAGTMEDALLEYDKVRKAQVELLKEINITLPEGITLSDYRKILEDQFAIYNDIINKKLKADLAAIDAAAQAEEAARNALEEQRKKELEEYERMYKDMLKRVASENKTFVSSIMDELLSLDEGKSITDNLMGGLQAFGKSLYTITKDSITEGIVQSLFLDESLFEDFGKEIKNTVGGAFTQAGFGDIFTQFKDIAVGAGVGAFTAGSTGRDAGAGGGLGAIGSMIGSAFGPIGMLAGGLLGGLLAPQKKQDEETVVDESLKYQRESTKELKEVNRNLVLMRQELRPWEYISDSYFFSQANSRGFVGA
jgi:TP901 family phage tail tape measure protein